MPQLRWISAGWLAAGILVVSDVGADELSDPTAPPDILRTPAEGAANLLDQLTGTRAPEPTPEPAVEEPPPEPRPKLVVREAVGGAFEGRTMINGALLRPGEATPLGTLESIGTHALRVTDNNETRQEPVVDHGVIKTRPKDQGQDQ